MQSVRPEVLDGANLAICRRADRCDARPDCFAVLMHRARAAKGDPTAEFCSGQPQHVAQVPEQGHVGIAIKSAIYPVHLKLHHEDPLSLISQAFCVPRYIETNWGQNPAYL